MSSDFCASSYLFSIFVYVDGIILILYLLLYISLYISHSSNCIQFI